MSELKARVGSLVGPEVQPHRRPNRTPERARKRLWRRWETASTVRRVGLTYLVNVNFSSHSATLTAQIANAAANAYVVG